MNTTTFTIESVHGVKQTFVLGPTGKPVDRDADTKPMSAPSKPEAEQRDSSSNSPR